MSHVMACFGLLWSCHVMDYHILRLLDMSCLMSWYVLVCRGNVMFWILDMSCLMSWHVLVLDCHMNHGMQGK